ncbi:MAG: PHP domain-containing protein, partial [Pseudomonadota bacterium]
MSYAELMAMSNFTFLQGASHAEELVARACELGLKAISITDVNTFAGIVRAHAAAKEAGLHYVVGVCLQLRDGEKILAYPKDRAAYGRLCRLLTIGKRRTVKGSCDLSVDDLLAWGTGSLLIAVADDRYHVSDLTRRLRKQFGEAVYLGVAPRYDGADPARVARAAETAQRIGAPLVALGDVMMHRAGRRMLADVLSCIREGVTI